jgi:hypothetical protein
MIKINYSFKALQPIHTGSDENGGTEKKLRREHVILDNEVTIKSDFTNPSLRRNALINILKMIWKSIDFQGMQRTRLMTIWDEFSSKVLVSSQVKTKQMFLNKICEKFNIRSLNNTELVKHLDMFNDDEFLLLLRNELQYLILRLKLIIQEEKTEKKQVDLFSIQEEKTESNEIDPIIFVKSFEEIPYISGNSIRGYLRRLLMYDFCKLAEIEKLDKSIYHQLFTGGNITSSTGTESLENREKYISLCPPIGLLGSAIGNQTIEGVLKVGGARLKCKEHGTGTLSFWDMIETRFQTRLDSSKTETNLELYQNKEAETVNQMIYQYEVFVKGSVFDSAFALMTDSELLKSCFYRMIELWKESNYIVGNSARDCGLIDLNIEIPENATEFYLNYISSNKEEIQKYFRNSDNLLVF